jgi:hypothetical protein
MSTTNPPVLLDPSIHRRKVQYTTPSPSLSPSLPPSPPYLVSRQHHLPLLGVRKLKFQPLSFLFFGAGFLDQFLRERGGREGGREGAKEG